MRVTPTLQWCGIYQFRRLPFGPKRAPSHFQEEMASVVIAGLLFFICEVYLDCSVGVTLSAAKEEDSTTLRRVVVTVKTSITMSIHD